MSARMMDPKRWILRSQLERGTMTLIRKSIGERKTLIRESGESIGEMNDIDWRIWRIDWRDERH